MKLQERMNTTQICTIGLLTALFVVLSMCLRVTVFDNFYVCLGYVVMYRAMALYGITGGLVVGTVGPTIYCLLISGIRGLPGWLVGNIVISVIVGLWMLITKELPHKYKWSAATAIIIIMATAIGMIGMKSFIEVVLYAQPMWLRVTNNFPAFITDALVLICSIPIYTILEPHSSKECKTEA